MQKSNRPEFWLAKPKGSRYWYIHWREWILDERGKKKNRARRETTGESIRAKAEEKLAAKIITLNHPERAPPEKILVAQVLEYYMNVHLMKLPSAATGLKAIEIWAEHLGSLTVAEINRARLERLIAHFQSIGWKNSTINRRLAVLRAALNKAYSHEIVAFVPPVLRLPEEPGRDRWLTRAEAQTLYNAAFAYPPMPLFIELALHTAARPSALLHLTWPQVDFAANLIHLAQPNRIERNKRSATIPMTETIKTTLLQEYACWQRESAAYQAGDLQNQPSDTVIRRNGQPLRGINKIMKSITTAAGLQNVTPNTLRHTAATWAAQAGSPMWQLAGFMGHTNSKTTEDRYARHSPAFMEEVKNALNTSLKITETQRKSCKQ